MKNGPNVISFLNMKGGVCKTTLCKEMALYLSEKMNKKVLVIDIDPQSNCTQSFFERFSVLNSEDDIKMENGEQRKKVLPTINNIFKKNGVQRPKLEDIIYVLTDLLHLVPGDLDTVFMERSQSSGSDEQRLLAFIYSNELKSEYDYIFIDCPPTYSFYTVSAILSSDFYFVPVKPDIYSILGLDLLQKVVEEIIVGNEFLLSGRRVENLGVIFTMAGATAPKGFTNNIDSIRKICETQTIYCFENEFKQSDKLSSGKLSKFIIDREDVSLELNLKAICEEFNRKVDEYGNE